MTLTVNLFLLSYSTVTFAHLIPKTVQFSSALMKRHGHPTVRQEQRTEDFFFMIITIVQYICVYVVAPKQNNIYIYIFAL